MSLDAEIIFSRFVGGRFHRLTRANLRVSITIADFFAELSKHVALIPSAGD